MFKQANKAQSYAYKPVRVINLEPRRSGLSVQKSALLVFKYNVNFCENKFHEKLIFSLKLSKIPKIFKIPKIPEFNLFSYYISKYIHKISCGLKKQYREVILKMLQEERT